MPKSPPRSQPQPVGATGQRQQCHQRELSMKQTSQGPYFSPLAAQKHVGEALVLLAVARRN